MSTTRPRLSAEERRAALVRTACGVFSKGSYRGATTSEIAREAGVTEPILYRHFASKRDLYLACVEEAWQGTRALWEAAIAEEPDPRNWLNAMGEAFLQLRKRQVVLANLWVQALTEASEDAEIREFLRDHIREVHDFVVDVIRRAQADGRLPADRDADAEAWIMVGLGLLGAIGRRLGALGEDDFERIRAQRHRWLTGDA